jgi:hypothetical protein
MLIINSPDNKINGIIFIFFNISISDSEIENIKKFIYNNFFNIFIFILSFSKIKIILTPVTGLLLILIILLI